MATNFRNIFDLFPAARTGFAADDGQVSRQKVKDCEDHRNGPHDEKQNQY
jgi:hypothetical protein